nr:MAG TPA: hypothetical protein [Caudoviricetes sp.]
MVDYVTGGDVFDFHNFCYALSVYQHFLDDNIILNVLKVALSVVQWFVEIHDRLPNQTHMFTIHKISHVFVKHSMLFYTTNSAFRT